MTDVARILGEFIAAWHAGERPRLATYVERVPPADRDDLADQIETFLMLAPEPEYSEETWAEMTSNPAVAAAAEESMATAAEPLGSLRERAGLSLAQLAERLGFSGRQRDKAAGLLQEVEAGRRPPSRSLVERLSDALGVPREGIGWSSGMTTAAFGVARAPADAEPEPRIDALADALLSDDEDWDEVDELFADD
jgi:transcriptional regulator with XRE-family HTH domain